MKRTTEHNELVSKLQVNSITRVELKRLRELQAEENKAHRLVVAPIRQG